MLNVIFNLIKRRLDKTPSELAHRSHVPAGSSVHGQDKKALVSWNEFPGEIFQTICAYTLYSIQGSRCSFM